MSINGKLFNLGNDVVVLKQLIDEHFPTPDEPWKRNILKESLVELLRIVNVIRMECYQSFEPKKEPSKKYDIRLEECSETMVKEISNYLQQVGVEFKVLDIKTGEFVEVKPQT